MSSYRFTEYRQRKYTTYGGYTTHTYYTYTTRPSYGTQSRNRSRSAARGQSTHNTFEPYPGPTTSSYLQTAYETASARSSSLAQELQSLLSPDMTFRRSRVWESGRELSYLRSRPGLLPEFVRDARRRHQDAQDALTHLETRVQSVMREVTLASEAASRAWDALWAARCARPEDFGMPSNNGGGVPRTDGEQNDANWDDDQEMRDAEQESEWQSRWDHHHPHHPDSSPSPAPTETYLALASQALSNHSTLTTFPDPPATPCANPSCHTTAPAPATSDRCSTR